MKKEFRVEDAPKPIRCILSTPSSSASEPAFIFTHGAGGTLEAAAVVNFSTGFSKEASILCFEGSSNLKSRAKTFTKVMDNQQFTAALGGRSLGARAAVVAATDTTQHMILVSYPLQGPNDVRDQILLNLPASVKVLFISGDRDSMCDLAMLRRVREKMACESSLITVTDADHGMNMKPKRATDPIGRKTGELAAKWLLGEEKGSMEGKISWTGAGVATWSGWSAAELVSEAPPSKKAKVGKTAKEVPPKEVVTKEVVAKEVVSKAQTKASKDETAETVAGPSRKRKSRS